MAAGSVQMKRAPSSAAAIHRPAQQPVARHNHHIHHHHYLQRHRQLTMVRPSSSSQQHRHQANLLVAAGRPQLSSSSESVSSAATNRQQQLSDPCSGSIRLLAATARLRSATRETNKAAAASNQSSSLSSSAASVSASAVASAATSLSNHLTPVSTRLPQPNAQVIKSNLSAARVRTAPTARQQQQESLQQSIDSSSSSGKGRSSSRSSATLRSVPITRNGVHQSIRLYRRTTQQPQISRNSNKSSSSINNLIIKQTSGPLITDHQHCSTISGSKPTSISCIDSCSSTAAHLFTLSAGLHHRSAARTQTVTTTITAPTTTASRRPISQQQYRTSRIPTQYSSSTTTLVGPTSLPAYRSPLLAKYRSSALPSSRLRPAESIQSLNQQTLLASRVSERRHRPASNLASNARFGLTSSTSSLAVTAAVKRVKPSPSPPRHNHHIHQLQQRRRLALASGQQQLAKAAAVASRTKEVAITNLAGSSDSGSSSSGICSGNTSASSRSSCSSSNSSTSSLIGASSNVRKRSNKKESDKDYLLIHVQASTQQLQLRNNTLLPNRKTTEGTAAPVSVQAAEATAAPELATRVNNAASAQCHVPNSNRNNDNMNTNLGVKNILQQVNNNFPSNILLDANVNNIQPTIDNQENRETILFIQNNNKRASLTLSPLLSDGENNILQQHQLDKTANINNKLTATPNSRVTKSAIATSTTLPYTLDNRVDSALDDQMVLGSPLDTPPPSEPDIETSDHLNNDMNCGIIKPAKVAELTRIQIREEPLCDYYDLEARPFARGKFAQVKRCINKDNSLCFAAKCIKKRRRLVDIRHEILLEIEALKLSYKTERIVKLYEVFETPAEMILILEMANGGELQRVLDDEEIIEERLVAKWVRQILEGLIQLHENDIAHLDIKPQNLLLTKPYPHGDIKLCDFGLSRRITKDCEIREICGTPDYVAPEILSYDPITLATDMWSLGVLTYVLLTGYSPFGSENKQQTFCNITQAKLDFPNEIFNKISQDAIDFMQKLIVREPAKRLTSPQADIHEWLNN